MSAIMLLTAIATSWRRLAATSWSLLYLRMHDPRTATAVMRTTANDADVAMIQVRDFPSDLMIDFSTRFFSDDHLAYKIFWLGTSSHDVVLVIDSSKREKESIEVRKKKPLSFSPINPQFAA